MKITHVWVKSRSEILQNLGFSLSEHCDIFKISHLTRNHQYSILQHHFSKNWVRQKLDVEVAVHLTGNQTLTLLPTHPKIVKKFLSF
jgi:hypothetical protein